VSFCSLPSFLLFPLQVPSLFNQALPQQTIRVPDPSQMRIFVRLLDGVLGLIDGLRGFGALFVFSLVFDLDLSSLYYNVLRYIYYYYSFTPPFPAPKIVLTHTLNSSPRQVFNTATTLQNNFPFSARLSLSSIRLNQAARFCFL